LVTLLLTAVITIEYVSGFPLPLSVTIISPKDKAVDVPPIKDTLAVLAVIAEV
jgi:hypothetical protein